MSETKSRSAKGASRPGPAARLALWIRQVIAELRKVIWPTSKELITYTTVVLAFVATIAVLVSVLDVLFTKAVLAVFGH